MPTLSSLLAKIADLRFAYCCNVFSSEAADDEISRLDARCQIFGIGLVTFNAANPSEPDFRIRVRPSRHEPDLFYTNKYMAKIEKELFT